MEDDGIRRFVVHHHRYDPERHQRRLVLVAAFDTRREYKTCLRATEADIERRRSAGEPVDPDEHATGSVYEPGHLRRTANGHVVRRMMEHGVDPGPWFEEHDLPRNVARYSTRRPLPRPLAHWARLLRDLLPGSGRP